MSIINPFRTPVSIAPTSSEATPASSTPSTPAVADVFETTGVTAVTSSTSLAPVTAPETTAITAKPLQTSFWYRLKQKFWTKIVTLAFTAAKLAPITKPGTEKLQMIPFRELDSDIAIDNIYVTHDVPDAEKSKAKEILYSVIRWFSSSFPIHTDNMPSIPDDFDAVLEAAYPKAYSDLIPAPVVPPELTARPDDIVGTLALEGPFAAYIQKVEGSENLFKIDLEKYAALAVREGLKPLGGTAYLSYAPVEKRMNTTSIHYHGKTYSPGSPEWIEVQKVILCSLSTDVTLIRHLTNTHLLVAGTFAGVNTSTLEADHPLRVLMHPHCHLTLSTNNYKVPNLIKSDASAVPGIFSYSKANAQKAMSAHAATFDVTTMDPAADAAKRGVDGSEFDYPYLNNAVRLRDVIEQYVSSYVDAYYPNDEAVQNDPQIQAWYDALNQYIPNGIEGYAPGISKETVVKLCTLLIHTGAVEHENVGNITWNYTTIQQYIPSLIPADGSNPPLDAYQRYINTSILTFIPLNKLDDDNSSIALDEKGAACMNAFRENLGKLQTQMENEGEFKYSTMYPVNLEGSVST